MLIKNLPEVEDVYVFPHMGDGGLAIGSAMLANYDLNGISKYNFKNVYFGPRFSNDYIKTALENSNLENVSYEYINNIERETAKIIHKGNIVLSPLGLEIIASYILDYENFRIIDNRLYKIRKKEIEKFIPWNRKNI